MNTVLNRRRTLGPTQGLAATLTLILLWSLSGQAQGSALAPTAERRVCPAGPPTCDHSSLQAAVNAAATGDVIKIATGVYTDMQSRPAPAGYTGPATITQLAYIDKTVTIRGGYTTSNWNTPDPVANPTTLDAQGRGRVLVIVGDDIAPVIEGLRITGGSAVGQGGHYSGGYDSGGGVFLSRGAAVIQKNLIFANTAGIRDCFGGGVWFYRDTSVLVNTVVTTNRLDYSAGFGAGLFFAGSATSRLLHTTIAGNTGGHGDGVYVYAAPDANAVTLTNSIIAAHAGAGVFVGAGNTATLDGTLWHGNGAKWDGSGGINHAHDIYGAPAFVADGFHLAPGSAAIDQGVDTGVAEDIDGESRPYGAGYDLGADEFTSAPVRIPIAYLPLVTLTR